MLALLFLLSSRFLLRPNFPEMAALIGLAVLPVALAVQRRVLRGPLHRASNAIEREDAGSQPREPHDERPLPISRRQVLDRQRFQDGPCEEHLTFKPWQPRK